MQFKQLFLVHSLFFHPLSLITISFLMGIVSYFFPSILPIIALTTAMLCTTRQSPKLALIILLLISFVAGYARTYWISYKHQQAVTYLANKSHNITLHITSIELTDRPYLKWLIEGTITDESHKALQSYSIRIYSSRYPQFEVGNTILFYNLATTTKNNESFNRYMIKNNLIGTYFISQLNYQIIHKPTWNWRQQLHTLKIGIIKSVRRKMNLPTYELFCSLFLGKKASNSTTTKTTKQLHKQWGTSHYLARSGLHMMIFIMLWRFLLSCLPVAWIVRHTILSLFAILYAALSWPSISFHRAFGLFLLFQTGSLLERRTSTLFHVLLVALAAIMHNPFHATFLDFQLSFGLAFILALIQTKLTYTRISNHSNSCATKS